ncbi:unnamed protein product [Meloidogyne enterolobii]|uniref:Uncharacterized protein n=1 Tax=Meloidogyne enterolobii TaxID=390850 RepID=A0ACB0ZT92_MELEN
MLKFELLNIFLFQHPKDGLDEELDTNQIYVIRGDQFFDKPEDETEEYFVSEPHEFDYWDYWNIPELRYNRNKFFSDDNCFGTKRFIEYRDFLEFGFDIKDELRMMRVNSTFQFNTLMRMLRLQEQDLRDQGRDVRELLDRMGLIEYRVGRIEAHLRIGDVANAIIVARGVPDNAAGGGVPANAAVVAAPAGGGGQANNVAAAPVNRVDPVENGLNN